jgi:hypothetical protein
LKIEGKISILEFLHVILELSIKYSKLGVLGLSSAKTGDEIKKGQAEQSTQEKKRIKTGFSHLISFHPQFWICLACSFTALLMFIIISSLIRLSSCKS